MKSTCVLSLILSASSLLAAPASAQTVYRCGNSYSQTPCAGGNGNAIAVEDSRDKTQKAQTDAAIRRDLKAAEALEKNRNKQEASRARAPRAYPDAGGYDMPLDEASTGQGYDNGRKSRKPEFFTARTAGEPNKHKKPAQHKAPKNEPAAETRR
jgi:hypothetical protein